MSRGLESTERPGRSPSALHRPATCSYRDCTVPDLLSRSAEGYPDSTALLFYGARLTYREFDALVTRFACALQRLGVHAGDRVAIMLPNCPQGMIAYYGALRAGAIVVQTNPLYHSQELEVQLRDAGAETIIALDIFYAHIQPIQDRIGLRRIILTCVRDFLSGLKRLLYPIKARLNGRWVSIDKQPPLYDFLTLLQHDADARDFARLPRRNGDDLALLQYTGGTTGVPKGVMLTHRNVIANASQCHAWMPDCREGAEVFLGVIPFFHVYGLSTCQHLAVMAAATLVLLPRFEVLEVLAAIQRYRVTVFSAIPMMFLKAIEHPKVQKYNLRSLRICLSGASPLHAELRDRFERLTGVTLTEGYGLTEAGPVTHCNPINGRGPQGSMGVLFPDTEARIVDLETGEREVPDGEAGELTVRGPQIMRGYWKNEAETRAVLRNGWLHTGDIVRKDPDGFFYLVDRKKDMIKTRGENVYPREVEEVLFRHPGVKDVVVAGVPDRLFGEAIKAYVVRQQNSQVTEAELIGYCKDALARFKVPSIVEFRNELPRTVVGKVLRRTLQKEEADKRAAAPELKKAG
ncbi:MAG TPA: long-chain fatty acid--CoA ligase [Nitrospirales bacterium]|nr:long-chain fatty acid--CoA ligase [Nitrospirales bacterium]